MGFLPKTSKIPINTPKYSRFFLILLDFPCFFLIIQQLFIADHYEKNHYNSPKSKLAE